VDTLTNDVPGTAPDAIDAEFVARLLPELIVEDVGGEQVVIGGPARVMVLNDTAALVFRFLDGEGTLGELADDLADALGSDPRQVRADVVEFAQQLAWNGLLQGISIPEPEIAGYEAPEPAAKVGDPLGEIAFTDFSGAQRSLSEFAGRRVLLVNWSPVCGFCTAIAGQLGDLEQPLRDERVELVFLTSGDEEPNAAVFAEGGLRAPVLLRADGGRDPFGGTGTPAAYLVDEQGVIADEMVVGANHLPLFASDLAGVEAADGSVAVDGVRYLPAPGAMCGPGGGAGGGANSTDWQGVRAYAFGEHHVGVRFDGDDTAAVLDRLFPGAAVDDTRAPENYSVALGGTRTTRGAGASRSLKLLVRGSQQLVRSRSNTRALAALLQHLSADLTPDGDPSLLRVSATAVVSNGRAALLPAGLVDHLKVLQPRLAKAGITLVDGPDARIDPGTAELVVPEPTIAYDASVLDAVDADVRLGNELPWVRPGRYPLAKWLVVRGPELVGALSPGLALTSMLGLVFGLDDLDATAEAVGRLRGLMERVPVDGTWYESVDALVAQARAAFD
jgi:thiol-disulfide isomerase/thioredoxin